MDKTSVKAEFSIIGDEFDLEVVTKMLNLIPSESYKKGDDIKGRSIKRIESCWSISTKEEESMDVNEQLDQIIEILKDKVEVLLKLRKMYEIEYLVMIIVKIENNEKPAMCFGRKFIKFINEIQAEFHIDMYIYSE